MAGTMPSLTFSWSAQLVWHVDILRLTPECIMSSSSTQNCCVVVVKSAIEVACGELMVFWP